MNQSIMGLNHVAPFITVVCFYRSACRLGILQDRSILLLVLCGYEGIQVYQWRWDMTIKCLEICSFQFFACYSEVNTNLKYLCTASWLSELYLLEKVCHLKFVEPMFQVIICSHVLCIARITCRMIFFFS